MLKIGRPLEVTYEQAGSNDNKVIIANRDIRSHNFKKDIIGSFSCSYSSHQTGLGERAEEADCVPQNAF